MPIYEYQCEKCGQVSEVMQKFADGPLDKCPACAAGPVKKLMSLGSFSLKGTGWYSTDYKKTSSGGSSSGPSGGAAT